jgi:sorting nexin-8
VPAIFNKAFAAVDPSNTGETSVNSLSRVLATSSLPAATIDRVRKIGCSGVVSGANLSF